MAINRPTCVMLWFHVQLESAQGWIAQPTTATG